MAIRTDPERIATEPRERKRPYQRGPVVPWPEHLPTAPSHAARPAGPGRPSMAGRPHPDRPDRQVGPAGRVVAIGLTCFLLWGLLAAPGLRRSAESSPLGIRRTAALAVLRPLSRVSAVIGLDQIGSWIDRALGRTHGPRTMPAPVGTPGLGEVGPPPTAVPSLRGPYIAGPLLHRPTKALPLRVLAVGDSIGEDLAVGLARALSGRKAFVLKTDAREATGLARPDYFDWAYQVAVDMRQFRPDIVVAAFGANDGQSFLAGGHGVRIGTAEWRRIYRQRAGRVMAEVTASGWPLIWVGMPPMAAPRLSRNMAMIDGLVRAEAASHRGVIYVHSWDLLAGPSGGYSAYLPSSSGRQELVRTSDGIHLTSAGLDRLASAVMQVMAALWKSPG